MDQNQIEDLVLRILNGKYTLKVLSKFYTIYQPSLLLRQQSQQFYYSIIEQNRFQHWLSENDRIKLLIKSNLLSSTYSVELKNLEDTIQNLKLDLYLSFLNTNKQKRLRRFLEQARQKLNDLHQNLALLKVSTLIGYAGLCQQEFLFLNTIYENDQLAFSGSTNFALFQGVCSCILSNYITEKQYRLIARSGVWRKYWQILKNNSSFFIDLTSEQLSLVSFSKMYDSVYESLECPEDDIITDDDMLDGWLIHQSNETKNKRKQQRSSNITNSKIKNSQEVFITANSPEDIQKIEALNTPQSLAIKKQREKVIQTKGVVKEKDFVDQKLHIAQQSQQQYIQTMRDLKKRK